MKTTIFVVLSLVSILWSTTASATWAYLFDIEFESQRAISVTWVKIFAGQDLGIDELWATSQIYEEGVHVQQKTCHGFRSGTEAFICESEAKDSSLTANCTYCNKGSKLNFEHSWLAAGTDGELEQAQSTTSGLNVRCDIPPDTGDPE